MKKSKLEARFWILIPVIIVITGLVMVGCDLFNGVDTTTEYTLTVQVEGNGTVTPEEGTHDYAEDEVVDLIAESGEGYEFLEWVGDVADNASAETTILMDEDKTVTALFVEEVESDFAGGNGTEGNPFLVETAEQLDDVRNFLDRHFRQIADIDLSEFGEGNGWEPIGTIGNNEGFDGSYDGDNYEIQNLTIDGVEYLGLFEYISENGRVENVILENISIEGGTRGGLVGENFGTIVGCSVSGEISGGKNGGGLVGYNAGTIEDCSADVEVTITDSGLGAGGLVGFNNGTIKNSNAKGNITTEDRRAGGLVGEHKGGIIKNSFAEGNVTSNFAGDVISDNSQVGGLVGRAIYGKIEDSYATGAVTAELKVAGGLVGVTGQGIEIINCYAEGKVTADEIVGGLVGRNSDYAVIENSYATGKVVGSMAGGLVGSNSTSAEISGSYAKGDVEGTAPAGGLVGYNNSKIVDSYAEGEVTGENIAGGLVGRNDYLGKIIDSYATGLVTGEGDYTGGLVGINSVDYNSATGTYTKGNIVGSHATGAVHGKGDFVGGLVGHNRGDIDKSFTSGDVTGEGEKVGGLIGQNGGSHVSGYDEAEVNRSYASGNVEGHGDYVGGLVGKNYKGEISNSYAVGNVESQGNRIGGLVGRNRTAIIKKCYTVAEVFGNGDEVGAMVGDGGGVEDSYYNEDIFPDCDKGGTGKTTHEMMLQSTYEDWDFDDTWEIIIDESYPYFQWQEGENIPTSGSG